MPRLSKIGAACLAAFGFTTGGVQNVTATYLVVAGGGGASIGGGGAGGYKTGTTSLNPTLSYTVTVGAGGVGQAGTTARGINGSDSVFNSITSTGGGGGGWDSPTAAGSGGSGGGAGSNTATKGFASPVGQGNDGGSSGGGTPPYAGGGGGGAGAVGGNGSGSTGGAGGAGTANSISGSSVTYAGGGGAGLFSSGTGGAGGSGGGGAGANSGNGNPGTANLGGGGGGAVGTSIGGNGGSGVVIIAYAGAQQFGGGVVTTDGTNTIHTFTTSGTLSPLNSLTASYLIVAGGGAGGGISNNGTGNGGGGAGGLLSGTGMTIDTNSTYLVTIGAGGTVTTGTGNNGTNSSFSLVSTVAVGGGGGGTRYAVGGNGGSGGGSGSEQASTSSGTAGQGYGGGAGFNGGNYTGGGGGGAGAAGGNGTSSTGGAGGVGVASSISGTSTYYAGGGGGGMYNGGTAGAGGNGGGGAGGATNGAFGVAGTANTGGGGGGGSSAPGGGTTGGNGGSGIVIISYPGSTQLMAGGTVTIVGGNVIHTFTSSGYLTPLTFVGNSLRFRNSASAYLNRTPPTVGNTKTWTISAWVKRGALSSSQFIFNAWGGSNSRSILYFTSNNELSYFDQTAGTTNSNLVSSSLYRDPAAWYHIVLAMDTTQATASNRTKLYVNGVQITSFSTATYIAQNSTTYVNASGPQYIGADTTGNTSNFDGYLTNIQLIDGQQLAPTAFGTFNSYGVWQPINYGGSYGTNGFYLPFIHNAQNYCGVFNGSSTFLNTAGTSSAWALGTSGTVEAWVYPTVTSANQRIVGNTNSTSAIDVFLSGTNQVSINSGSGGSGATTTTTIPLNQWTHIAVVYNSGTASVYFNGVSQPLTGTTTGYNITNTSALYIGNFSGGGLVFNGSISNVRIVKGVAVYTSNFTPSATALTAVTGTQLLTLQNSTIIDNSSNAFAITNNGSVTVQNTYPFSAGYIFNDQSPQGNHWTNNNIATQYGPLMDAMTDVPTLTSATVANYATGNPLNSSYATTTMSNGNLQWNGNTGASGNWSNASSTIAFDASGNYYCEVTASNANGANGSVIGVLPATISLVGSNTKIGDYTGGVSWQNYLSGGTNNLVKSAVASVYNGGVVFTTGDVLGIQVNAGSVTFYKNGVSQGVAATGLSGLYYFAGGCVNTENIAFNFGQQGFKYSVPSGALALNTYNM